MKPKREVHRVQFTFFPGYMEKLERLNQSPFDSVSVFLMRLIDRELAKMSQGIPETPSDSASITPQPVLKEVAKTESKPTPAPQTTQQINRQAPATPQPVRAWDSNMSLEEHRELEKQDLARDREGNNQLTDTKWTQIVDNFDE